MGKSEARQLTSAVTVRCTDDERERWESAANAADLTSRSAWCRAAILAFERMGGGFEVPDGVLPEDADFRAALGRVRTRLLQAEDGPALRYCVLAVDRLLRSDEGRALLFGEVVERRRVGGGPKKNK